MQTTASSLPTTWSWYENGKLRYHEIQTILDILAYSQNIPVRLLDWNGLCGLEVSKLLGEQVGSEGSEERIYRYVDKLEELFAVNSEEDAVRLQQEASRIIKCKGKTPYEWISKHEREVWITLPSSPLPIHTLFRMNKEWCWYILIWFWKNRRDINHAADKQETMDALGIKQWEFHFRWVNFTLENEKKQPEDQTHHLLIFGPIYKPTGTAEARDFSQAEGKCLIQAFRRFHAIACADSMTPLEDDQIMHRMLLARLPLIRDDISRRVINLFQALTAMLPSMRPKEMGKYQYRFNDFFVLVRAYASLFRCSDELYLNGSAERCLVLFFPLTVPEDRNRYLCIEVTAREIDEKVCLSNWSANWPVEDKNSLSSFEDMPYLAGIYQKNSEGGLIPIAGLQRNINLRMSQYDEPIISRRRFFQNLCGDMLHAWLQDHMGQLLGTSAEKKLPTGINPLHKYICGVILEDLRADLCHLWQYDHQEDKVKLLGCAYRQTIYSNEWNRLKTQMEDIPNEDKYLSAVFRCLGTGHLDNYETPFLPNGEPAFYLKGLNSDLQTQSGLVTPIFFQGRIFGIMEISGLVRYQFSWTHQYTLSNIVAILGDYLYQERLLFSLKELTQLSFAKHKHSPQNKENLSRLLSKIFLCKGATILLKNRTETDRLTLFATTHPNVFDCQPKDMHGYTTILKDGCLFRLYEEYEKTGKRFGQQGELDSTENFAKELMSLGLKQKLAFVITREDPTQKLRKKDNILGVVILHDDQAWKEGNQWQTIINLISGQLVAVLEILDALYSRERDDVTLITHEILQDCKVLKEIPRNVKASLKALLDFSHQMAKSIEANRLHPSASIEEWKESYQSLSKLFYSGPIDTDFLPDLRNLKNRLDNLEIQAKLLTGKIQIYEKIRQEGGELDLKQLFGGAANLSLLDSKLDLRNVCQDILQARISEFHKKGIHVELDYLPRGIYLVDVYPQMISHWIKNMFDNALKYSESSTMFSITVERRKLGEGYRLMFENEGKPIPEEESLNIKNIFERGVRFSNAPKGTGDGLGLYMVGKVCDYLCIKMDIEYVLTPPANRAKFRFMFDIPPNRIKLEDPANKRLRLR